MPATPRWTAALRRLDRFRTGPVVAAGLLLGALAGAFVAVSPHPATLFAFIVVIGLATFLALTAEPIAEEVKPRSLRAGDERVHAKDGTVLVRVPGGEYTLGADDLEELFADNLGEEQAAELADRSKPVHK